MPKVVKTTVKLQLEAGKATPAPPVGTALGPHGVNIQEFCVKFNEATKSKAGEIVPIVITIYDDRSFTFITKTPPAAALIKKAAGIQKGSGKSLQEKVGSLSRDQIRHIAEIKMPDLNARSLEAAMRIIEGTARQMGVTIRE